MSYIFVLFWKKVSWFSFLNFCFFYFILGWAYVGCHEYSLSNLYVRKIKSENHNWENYFSLWAGDLIFFFLNLIFSFFNFFLLHYFIFFFHLFSLWSNYLLLLKFSSLFDIHYFELNSLAFDINFLLDWWLQCPWNSWSSREEQVYRIISTLWINWTILPIIISY